MRTNGVKRVAFSSTGSVYGEALVTLWRSYDNPYSPAATLRPNYSNFNCYNSGRCQ